MTIVKIIPNANGSTDVKKLQPIEFTHFLEDDKTIVPIDDDCSKPEHFNYIELICFNYTNDADLMFCYNDNRNDGTLYLGKFNDGVVTAYN